MSQIKKAVILAAGLGSRLKPLTEEIPKCLTEVNGRAILEHILNILERNGIEETVIVIGHLGNAVIDKIGHKYHHMKITYIWNEVYEKTNSMYSAWLAREYLEQGALLIEVVFSWPGMGTLLYDAIGARDYPLLQAAFFIIAVCMLLANFLADVLYTWLDPRTR